VVTIEDNTAPVVVCQDIILGLDVNGIAILTPSDIDGGSSDNCSGLTLSIDPDNEMFTSDNLGVNTVTLTATDSSGNTAICDAKVTIEDISEPTAVCEDVIVVLDSSGNAEITASDLDNGSTDNGIISSISASQTTFNCTDIGVVSVTLTVTDTAGNSSTCVSTITVEETTIPDAVCQDLTLELDALGNASINTADLDNGSSDNCGVMTMTASQTEFDCTDVGANTVILTVEDSNGNTSTCASVVTVADNTAPLVVCQDIILELDVNGIAILSPSAIDAGSSDNCSGLELSIPFEDEVFTSEDLGVNTVTLTATDDSGNSSTCSTTVTIEDTILPTAMCQDIIVILDSSGNAEITADDLDDESTDNGIISSISASQTTFNCTDIGVVSVTLTVTDTAGNSSTCVSSVTVEETSVPDAICQDLTLQLDAQGNASINASEINNGSSDNCGVITMSASQTEFDCSDLGSNSIVLTVEDANGNTSTCASSVTVEDNIAPIIVCQDIIIDLDAEGIAILSPDAIDGGSSDNCSGIELSIPFEDEVFNSADLGVNVVTLTATDSSGNTSTCNTTVTVEDNIQPTAICQDITISLDSFGIAVISASDIDNGSVDNAGIITLEISRESFSCIHLGQNTVVLTVEDESGNTDTCEATVTVEDTTAPFIDECLPNVFVPVSSNCEFTMEDYTSDLEFSDNCSNMAGISVEQIPAPGTIISGVQEVECTVLVTDAAGNTNQCEFSLFTTDQSAPTIDCTDVLTVNSNTGCDYQVEALDNFITINDNCNSIVSIAQTPLVGEIISEPTTATVVVTDAAGNIATCQFLIEIENSVPPSVECPPSQILDLNDECLAILPDFRQQANVQASCGSDILTVNQIPEPGTLISESTVITITATDTEGNMASCDFIVDVVNTKPPIVECIENQTIEAVEGCGALVPDFTSEIQVTTHCGSTIESIIQEPAAGQMINSDQIIVVTVVDSGGNSSSCEFELSIIDTTAPIINCPVNIVQSDSIVNYTLPEFTDNCSAELKLISGLETGSAFPHGFTNVIYEAEDLAGNTDSCEFTVLVNNDPVAVEDTIFIASNVMIHLDSLLTNDYDPDGDSFSLSSFENPNPKLDISITEEGIIEIELLSSWCGREVIQYTICDEFGACSEANVVLEIECATIMIPEGFSPNGDGLNDYLIIEGLEFFPNNNIQIFNRWGKRVYEEDSYQNSWFGLPTNRGFIGGDKLPVGTYFVILDLGDGSKPIRSYIYLSY